MQLIIERITGRPLASFAAQHVFAPLGMSSTRFRPDTTDAALMRRIAPTELDSIRGQIHGTVHDPNAWALGGVSGHAGLFSTARDMAKKLTAGNSAIHGPMRTARDMPIGCSNCEPDEMRCRFIRGTGLSRSESRRTR